MAKPSKDRLSTVSVALIGVFSALWVVLNLTVAPLSFALLHLPVIHSVVVFLMLLLVAWATGQYGAASIVSMIGSAIVVLANPSVLPVLGFVPAALLFDVVMILNRHKVNFKIVNVGVVVLASAAGAFLAALVNGFLILSFAWQFTLTVWAGWNVLGALIGIAVILPIVGALERANVKRVQAD